MRKGAKNYTWLLAGNYVSYGLSLLTVVLIARELGPEKYGNINAAVAFIGMFSFLKLPGFDKVFIRESSYEGERESEYYSQLLGLKLAASALGAVVALVVMMFVDFTHQERVAIVLFATTMFTQPVNSLLGAVFQIREDMKWMSVVNLVRQSSYILIASVGLYLVGVDSVVFIMCALVASYWVGLVAALLAVRRYMDRPLRATLKMLPKAVVKSGLVFSATNVVVYMYTKIDILMTRLMIGPAAAGLYAVALNIYDKVYSPFMLVSTSFFPRLVKKLRTQKVVDLGFTHRVMLLFGCMGVVIGLAGLVGGEPIIRFLFEEAFDEAGRAFTLLLWSLPPTLAMIPMLMVLQATRNEIVPVKLSPIRATMNVGFNVLFILKGYGIVGVAWSTIVTSVLFNVVFYAYSRRVLRASEAIA